METFGAGGCGHIFCYSCALHMLNDEESNGEMMKVQCPFCKITSEYKKLM